MQLCNRNWSTTFCENRCRSQIFRKRSGVRVKNSDSGHLRFMASSLVFTEHTGNKYTRRLGSYVIIFPRGMKTGYCEYQNSIEYCTRRKVKATMLHTSKKTKINLLSSNKFNGQTNLLLQYLQAVVWISFFVETTRSSSNEVVSPVPVALRYSS